MTSTDPLVQLQQLMNAWADTRRTPWGIEIPKFATPVTVFGTAAVPVAYGTQVLVLQYQVKANFFAFLSGVVLGTDASPQPNAGDISWTIDVDRPLGDQVSGYAEKDYGAVPVNLGDFVGGPVWPVEFKHQDGEIIRIKATAVQNMGVGGANVFKACLIGFDWPMQGIEG